MLQCSQHADAAGFRPKWTFTATKLVGLDEAKVGDFRRADACSAK
jgi:hypothetical protein